MARVSEEEIERIKREVSIVALIESYGVKLSGSGDNLKGRCPLRGHDDRTPSLVVSPSKSLWHCMGKCQTGGSVVDFVMKADGVSFRHAVEMLRKKTLSAASRPATRSKLEDLAEPHEPDRVSLLRVANFYRDIFKGTAEGPAYCDKRGLRNREVLEALSIGYSNRTLGYHLPDKRSKEGAAIHTQLQRLGVLRPSGHEHFVGSLVVPIFSEDGEVLEMYGRKIRDDLRKGTPSHLYLPRRPDGRRGVFNLPALKASKDVIVCEALLDAITFLCAGIPNVTSAYGVEGFTKEMREAFAENGIERVLIAYDRDEAGDRAAEKLSAELAKDGLSVFRVLFPKGMDANEYAQKVQPASKSLEVAVRNAQWMAGARNIAVLDAIVEHASIVAAAESETKTEIALSSSSASEAKAEIGSENTRTIDEAPRAEDNEIVNALSAVLAPVAAAHDMPPASDVSQQTATPEPPSLDADRPTQQVKPNAPKLEAGLGGDDEIRIELGDRHWRIRGLARNTTYESLKLNVHVTRGDSFFVDTVELYSARQRYAFVKATSADLGVEEIVIKSDVGKIVRQLEGLVHQRIEASLLPKPAQVMTEAEREEALALLRDHKLLDRILDDFDRAGVVGEENNKLLGYLAATSRKLEAPLAVVIQSSSAAGKSSLMDAMLRFMPEEERVEYSAMTGQSLFYMGETDLSHKILAVAEEQGVQSAEYALKLLQSEGKLKIASTGKDPNTGKLITHDYEVKGPVQIFLTTTAIEVDEELLNRCVVLTVDEGMKQTSAIHERQRDAQTLEGLLARRDRERIVKLHQNAQRLLAPLFVANPFAKTLRFPNQTTRARRDHMKYLTLIRTIALLHQHQRAVQEIEHCGERIRYIEVTKADISIADQLAHVVLGHDDDDMPPQTRRLLELVEQMVGAEAKKQGIGPGAVRFTRKDIRRFTKWSHSTLKKHLARLEDLEHLLVHGGGARRRTIYELAKSDYDPSGRPQNASGHPLVTLWSPPGGRPDSIEDLREKRDLATPSAKAHLRDAGKVSSYSPTQSYSKLNGASRGA